MSPPMTTQAGDTPPPICPEVEEDRQSASGGIWRNTYRVLGQPGSIQVSPNPILTDITRVGFALGSAKLYLWRGCDGDSGAIAALAHYCRRELLDTTWGCLSPGAQMQRPVSCCKGTQERQPCQLLPRCTGAATSTTAQEHRCGGPSTTAQVHRCSNDVNYYPGARVQQRQLLPRCAGAAARRLLLGCTGAAAVSAAAQVHRCSNP